MRHLFVVDSMDKHIQNEKELIRPRRILPHVPGSLFHGLNDLHWIRHFFRHFFSCFPSGPVSVHGGGCQTSQASSGVQLSYLEFSPSCLVPS